MSAPNHHPSNTERPCDRGIVVVDYGSQYTLLIARRLREIGIYSEVVASSSEFPPKDFHCEGVILSGGPDSAHEEGAQKLPRWVVKLDKPILGICYGLQLLMQEMGGKIRSATKREYGAEVLKLKSDMAARAAQMFYDMPTEQTVWMSHGDDVEKIPDEFEVVGHSQTGVYAAVVHRTKPIVGIQFHPEVQHSVCGKQMLEQFVTKLCRLKPNWHVHDMLTSTQNYVRKAVGSGKVLMAVSGGVDSTVAAVLLSRTLEPDQLTTVFVDHGLLRKNEVQWVKDNFRFLGIKNFEVLDRQDMFLSRLAGVSDPETKRKIIGTTFIEAFEQFAKSHKDFTHLGQGTLYPDVIESAGHGSAAKVIKSHHNVGGLPEKLHLKLIEPFRFLFKDEVRKLGEELGIPHALVQRHPFPGPGLAIRIMGDVNRDDIKLVQEADHIFIEALRSEGLYDKVWQAFCVILPVKTVGVMGDNRTYEKTLCLRAVSASDGMTADVGDLPLKFLTRVADQIIRNVKGINRVLYDVTTKPPATIEWE